MRKQALVYIFIIGYFLVFITFLVFLRQKYSLEERYGKVTWSEAGLRIADNGFNVDRDDFQTVVMDTYLTWDAALTDFGEVCDIEQKLTGVYISFRDYPFYDSREGDVPLAGLTSFEGNNIVIQVGTMIPLSDSALAHELGHAILSKCMNIRTEEALKTWHRDRGTPY